MREDEGAAEVLAALAAEPWLPGRVHLGWGSFRNLDLVAARRSDAALLLDVNEHQREVWECVERALLSTDGPRAFARRLADLLPANPRPRRFRESLREWLEADLARPGSWLEERAPERHAHLRALFAAGRVGVTALDVRDAALAPLALAAAACGGEARADTIYLSTLPWMVRQPRDLFGEPNPPGGAERMWEQLATLASDATWLVRAEALVDGATLEDPRWRTEVQRFPEARRRSREARGRRAS
jgi:hypothetical protein